MTQEEKIIEGTAKELSSIGIDTKEVNLSEIDAQELEVLQTVNDLSQELAEEFIAIVDGEVTSEEVVSIVNNESFDDIPDEAKVAIVAAVNESDDEVKKTFQNEVNVFSEASYGHYVPVGSAINVEQRRVLVAAGATIMAAAAPTASGGRKR